MGRVDVVLGRIDVVWPRLYIKAGSRVVGGGESMNKFRDVFHMLPWL